MDFSNVYFTTIKPLFGSDWGKCIRQTYNKRWLHTAVNIDDSIKFNLGQSLMIYTRYRKSVIGIILSIVDKLLSWAYIHKKKNQFYQRMKGEQNSINVTINLDYVTSRLCVYTLWSQMLMDFLLWIERNLLILLLLFTVKLLFNTPTCN